jgi:hypothetical protein
MTTREEQGATLIDAIEAGLRPMLGLLRNYGVPLLEMKESLARLYVYDTEEMLQKEGRPTTTARLSVMTGLTRSEVEKHLTERRNAIRRRKVKMDETQTPAVVLAVWNTDKRFSTPYGVALDLSTDKSRQRSFADLVEVASPGADPDAVLDQLLVAGCAEVVNEGDLQLGFIRCTDRAYIPRGISLERINGIGRTMSALNATLAHNLFHEASAGYLERYVQSDFPVSDEGKRTVRDFLATEITRLLDTIDAWFTTNRAQLESSSDGNCVGLNLFMYDVRGDSTQLANS